MNKDRDLAQTLLVRWQRWLSGLALEKVLRLEETTDEVRLCEQIVITSIPSLTYYFMLSLSAGIATFGLIANSAPAIIGAMIVAPLMSPIIGLSLGVVMAHKRLITMSVFSIMTGTMLVIGIGYVCAEIFGLRVAGSEILARTAPTTLDLGIALCAGGAAAFAHSRVNIANSIAGVAIAVSLVPPLAVCGIGLALGGKAVAESGVALSEFGLESGGYDAAVGAIILFLTNITGIVGVAVLVFLGQHYGAWRRTLPLFLIVLGTAALLFNTLDEHFHNLYVKNRVLRQYALLAEIRPDLVSSAGIIQEIRVSREDNQLQVSIYGMAPRNRLVSLVERADEFRQILSDDIGEPLTLTLELFPIDLIEVVARSPETIPESR